MRDKLKEKIAGEITLSKTPGLTIRKWRETFEVSQQVLSKQLEISPSVISDYESGRRKSPGISTIRKLVDAFIEIDESRGGKTIAWYGDENTCKAIIDMKEFPVGISAQEFIEEINGANNTPDIPLSRKIYGYTIIDSLQAITTLRSSDYPKIYGWTSERALIFTGVRYGRSPMVAIRAHPLKPALVVYIHPDKLDPLAIKIAELEKLPLITTKMEDQDIIETLKKY